MNSALWQTESVPDNEQVLENRAYRSFLVRCWREEAPMPPYPAQGDDGQENRWRYIVMEVGPNQRWHGLATLDDLICFLRVHLAP